MLRYLEYLEEKFKNITTAFLTVFGILFLLCFGYPILAKIREYRYWKEKETTKKLSSMSLVRRNCDTSLDQM